MIEPLQLVWMFSIAGMLLILIVLLEIHRINYRRENEVMFGTESFDEKVKCYAFSDKQRRTLEKMIRASSFENKDAVLNSSGLFEEAVTNFYEFRNVLSVRDETLESVESIRNMLDFTASNPASEIYSTRQYNVGDRIDLCFDEWTVYKRSEILWRNEKEWAVSYDGRYGDAQSLKGRELTLRWTRPDDAVYSARLPVHSYDSNKLIFPHTALLDKKQLRRWVRIVESIPVVAEFEGRESCSGVLFDLSAGGISVGLPMECPAGMHLRIRFELPSFGEECVEIQILRVQGHRNPAYPDYHSHTAAFVGAFGWTQEKVLQYIFQVNQRKKSEENLT
ncbi:MAG: PilZ domain-containing protein [Fibrobacter sp.]|nr:PilZ domain-containing protein [Fibrobacter sp.]